MTIQDLTNEYKDRLDYFDIELLLANSLNKTREFILTHPEYDLTKFQSSNFKAQIKRRLKGEPIAYILGRKEFYGLNFIVNKHTLVPRPETELMVELAVGNLHSLINQKPTDKIAIVDIGTGSGNIIISIANQNNTHPHSDVKYFAVDISTGALEIAKKNAKLNGVTKKIKFSQGSLLEPFLKNKLLLTNELLITANLPYLSKEIYACAPVDVKKFEPKSALYSPELGLQHYRKLLEQIQTLQAMNRELQTTIFLEISPEQKKLLPKLIKSIFPVSKIEFKKDLAGKWRICKITF